jgi:hypothetical protein
MNKENIRSHRVCTEFIIKYFKSKNVNVIQSQNPNYDFIIEGKRCKVLAHQKTAGLYVIEYICGDRSIDRVGYDDILYMDPTDKKSFYRVSVDEVFKAIQEGMKNIKNKDFKSVTNNNVLENGGVCIGISERAFYNINGFVKYIF